MKYVVDVNVILSAILGVGNSSNIFSLNYIFNKFDFISPEFVLIEIGKHSQEIMKRTSFSKEELQDIINFVSKQITFISEEQYRDKIKEAKSVLKEHQKDLPYLALAMKFNCKIFSGDKILKKIVPEKVTNPKEMLDIFYSN